MKLTKVFYKIRAAIHSKCPECKGDAPTWENPGKCSWCNGSGKKYRYIRLIGSSRSSKTTSIIQNFYTESWNDEFKRFSVWRDTKKDCKDTVGKDIEKIFPTMPYYTPNTVSLHKTESIYTFPSGSTIEICGTDDAEKVHGFNGDVAWCNEPYSISRETFDQIDMRTSMYVIIDMNLKQSHWADDIGKDKRCITIHSTYKDNPFCPPEQKRKILSYQPVKYSSVVRDGVMSEGEAQVYNLTENKSGLTEAQLNELARCKENERTRSANQFNWQVYGLGEKAEKPNRIFNWTEISDEEYNKLESKIYYGVDWGTVDPWAIVEAKYYDGGLYLRELNYLSENQIRANLLPTEISQVEGLDEGLVKWVFDRLNISKKSVIVCDNNREMKVIALRQAGYDYAIKASKGEDSIREGISLLQSINVFYTSSSKNIQYEQENYEWGIDRYGFVGDNNPVDRNNHTIDSIRYIANFLKIQRIIKAI